jgi:hypothetical protein
MKTPQTRFKSTLAHSLMLLALGLIQLPAHGAATDLNDIPMAVSNQVKGNFLVVLDNSQSMDAFMGGALQSGDNPNTRGNIGRDILRSMLGNYRASFNWGLMSFATVAAAPSLVDTYVYLMGNDNGMVLTDDCVPDLTGKHLRQQWQSALRCESRAVSPAAGSSPTMSVPTTRGFSTFSTILLHFQRRKIQDAATLGLQRPSQ